MKNLINIISSNTQIATSKIVYKKIVYEHNQNVNQYIDKPLFHLTYSIK